ncbi:hypothetical protein DIURU_003594 [Diutina rugosa]|uniref:Uncharacterized protein n=1 Tax=Diutina rugosa TaxID=5481 RepID=A0A642UT38_DIURU|nr:uncharacterized protein DIURU_003594 [Diutina rugosa]KAA8901224.1 hypothetical protein DIURU_003594 [Diutina rugosa]
MSDQFLNSSPSRNLIDPLIYQNSPSVAKAAKEKPTKGAAARKPSASALPAPASSTAAPHFATGLTPYVSKTYFQDISFSLTPHKDHGPVDYAQGLNLTPFLSHNCQIPLSVASNSISHQLSNITPFHDKTLQLNDFFMDSPLNQKDIDASTPSKFNFQSASKRTINQVDTPPRSRHKLSISHKPQTKVTPSKTPSRGLRDITNTHGGALPPVKETPQRDPDSSPSTLIVSSAIRSNETDVEPANNDDDDDDDDDESPPSPTPQKDQVKITDQAPPVMGTFSSKTAKKNKNPKPPKRTAPANHKFQIVFTDVHTLMNSKSKKNKQKRPPQRPQSTSQQSNPPTNKPPQQPHLGAGMVVPPANFGYQQMMQAPPTANPAIPPPPAKSDVTCNTSKEISMMSAHQNHTTEHTSFEMAHVSSTPNGKFILDKVFERVSPSGFGYGSMPPPSQPIKGANTVPGASGPMLMMSTPQHQSVINYAMYGSEMSPSTEAVMPMFASPTNYAMLHPHQMCPQPPPPQDEDAKAHAKRYDLH